ncbi:hypothetical protein M758_3G037100 [Ceratodon purpureus]|nr:hypothetical protein M758_3G037100 [Ceratodon purpureus]
MRTDAKDLALSVFQRQKDRCVRPPDLAFAVSRRQKGRCIRPPVGELPKEASCEDGPPVTPGMAAQGSAAMNVYNNELTHLDLGIEELREKKEKIKKVMQLEEEEKANIQREVAALAKRLAAIDKSLSQKYAYVEEYDKTIQDVESAYCKV